MIDTSPDGRATVRYADGATRSVSLAVLIAEGVDVVPGGPGPFVGSVVVETPIDDLIDQLHPAPLDADREALPQGHRLRDEAVTDLIIAVRSDSDEDLRHHDAARDDHPNTDQRLDRRPIER